MEENHERLRGRPADWIHKVKEDIFSDNEHITAKKVRDKHTNMKKAWKDRERTKIYEKFFAMAKKG